MTGYSIWSYSDVSDRGFGLFKRRVFAALEDFGWRTHLAVAELGSAGFQDQLREDLRQDNPDFLFLINQPAAQLYNYLNLEQSEELRRRPKIVWFLDDPTFYVNRDFEPDEIVCLFDDTYADAVRPFHPRLILHFPLAADLYTPVKPDERFFCEVAFVGGLQDQADRRRQLPGRMQDYVDRLVEAKLGSRIKRFEDLIEEIPYAPGKRINLEPMVRHFLYWETNNRYRIRLLEQLVNFDLRVYGNEDWVPLIEGSPLRSKFLGSLDPTAELLALFVSAQVNINIHSVQCAASLNQRDFNAPLAGGFLLSDWVPGAGRYFVPDEEAMYFTDAEDLRAKVAFYLAHPEEREQIVRAGRERVLRSHTYQHRVAQLLDALNLR